MQQQQQAQVPTVSRYQTNQAAAATNYSYNVPSYLNENLIQRQSHSIEARPFKKGYIFLLVAIRAK